MSTTYTHTSSTGRRSRLEVRTGHVFRRLAEWLRARRDRRITIGELNALDDRILYDIGIPRSAIGAIAENRFHERMTDFDDQWKHLRHY
ncbi:MAG: DUF1127 domain-containing protein [Hyphomicrobiaceae bacterium]